MRRISVVRRATPLITAGLVSAGLFFGAQGASAREITDLEASKLTLDALTATPVAHHVTHHSHHSASHRHSAASHHQATSRHSLVHTVVYHAKPSSTHGKKRHSRHHG
ncbi:hypothetical protein [Swaminathania salitolerans]|uniref:hypothetical protein n=1 Tax=Swaminathania salitolerans TaxID=182838 RepID=UPI0011BF6D93|nr:hypothetical protein [Swaminathania salitolerans]